MPSDTAAAKQLLEREHVAVVPGEAFGAPGYCAFPTRRRSSESKKGCGASSAFSAAPAAASDARQVILSPARLEPVFSPRPWGSLSLAPFFPEQSGLAEPIGEAWMTGSDCRFATGPFSGRKLGEAWPKCRWNGQAR